MVDQHILREKVPEKSEKLIVFVQTHNPKNPPIFEHLVKLYNLIQSTGSFSKTFAGTKLIKSERQPQKFGFSTTKIIYKFKRNL